MKKVLLILVYFGLIIYGQDSTKQFVSTIGSKIYLNENAGFFSKYGVIKIKNVEGKNKFIEILRNNVLYEKNNHKMMLNLLLIQIENRDYSNETIFIVYSPATFNVDFTQPYYYESSPTSLIFDKKVKDKSEKEPYSSIRVYLLSRDKTKFNKFILNDTSKIKLEIEEL